jgi:hypothetical protein
MRMSGRKKRRQKDIQMELDLTEHAYRLKTLPVGNIEWLRQALVWMAGGVILLALGWLALGR